MHAYTILLSLIISAFLSYASPTFAYNAAQLATFQSTKICESCDFNSLNLSADILGSEHYSDASLLKTYMYGSTIAHLDLQRLKAKGLIAVGLTLHNNDLSDADFSYAELPHLKVTQFNRGDHINFTGSGLDHSDFAYTQFEAPQFSTAAMRHALLYRVQWPRADLSYALLQSADLTFAQLKEANLQGAILTGAVISHADLSGANLYEAKITADQLKQALSVCGATLPDGSRGHCNESL